MTTLLTAWPVARGAWAAEPTPTPQPTPSAPPSPVAATAPSSAGRVAFDRAENGVLYFKVPPGSNAVSSVKAGLFEVNFLGTLAPDDGGMPYFLLTGRPCADCTQDRQIFVLRPNGEKPTIFVYPGKIVDPRSGERILESRAFYGHCLNSSSEREQYVVFQKERVDRRRKLQNSVFVAEPKPEHLSERLIERGLPRIETTLRYVRQKVCHEVDGRYRTMMKRSVDLRSRAKRAADAADDDDEDSPTKENQTDEDLSDGG